MPQFLHHSEPGARRLSARAIALIIGGTLVVAAAISAAVVAVVLT